MARRLLLVLPLLGCLIIALAYDDVEYDDYDVNVGVRETRAAVRPGNDLQKRRQAINKQIRKRIRIIRALGKFAQKLKKRKEKVHYIITLKKIAAQRKQLKRLRLQLRQLVWSTRKLERAFPDLPEWDRVRRCKEMKTD